MNQWGDYYSLSSCFGSSFPLPLAPCIKRSLPPKMPTNVDGIESSEIHSSIKLLINNLVNITDTTGEFLLTLPDGRVIDTKGLE